MQSNCLIAFLVTSMCLDSLIVWVGSSVPGKGSIILTYHNKIDEIASRWHNFVNTFEGIGINRRRDESHLFYSISFFLFFLSPSVVGQIFRVGTNSFAVSS